MKDRRQALIVPLNDDVQRCVGNIGGAFPPFVSGDDTAANFADPWVVALAMANGLTVVTQETRPGSPDSPTIPRVCTHFSVPFVDTFGFMRREGWKF